MTTETASATLTAPAASREPVPITVTYGDGIGPEIMKAVLFILEKGGAHLTVETVNVGEQVYLSGNTSGIPDEAWESIYRTRVLLKAPITTPQGSGYKSLNVTLRKTLGLFANVRPCVNYAPFVPSKHPHMDMVIIRENEEDLYAGIEHRQTDEVVQCLKLISRPGTEKIIRYAFEYARMHGRRKVTCMTKDNIMKMTDGLFHRVFREVGQEYPDIEQDHYIIDIGSARLADTPDRFDVIVTLNLYGDILSDIAAQVSGSVGLAGSANVGSEYAMFEAIHGSAPDIAGRNMANPSGLLMGALQMLVHIGQSDVAENIHNAWLRTIEDGFHTADIFNEAHSKICVSTDAFAQAVVDRLGERPRYLQAVSYAKGAVAHRVQVDFAPTRRAQKQLVGVDVFLHWPERSAERLGSLLNAYSQGGLSLQMITNRGVKVWPQGHPATFCTDHWRCRFQTAQYAATDYGEVLQLLNRLHQAGFDIIKTENLFTFDGEPGFSLGQGQ